MRGFFSFKYVSKERRRSMILACVLFWSIITFVVFDNWGFGLAVVNGDSMKPTLLNGERRIFHRWIYMIDAPQRGDVVVVEDPYNNTTYTKRIIALPNDRIRIKNSEIYINNEKIFEEYLPKDVTTSSGNLGDNQFLIEDGYYFVIGDNREESFDSRQTGAIHGKYILGKINTIVKKDE